MYRGAGGVCDVSDAFYGISQQNTGKELPSRGRSAHIRGNVADDLGSAQL